VVWKLLRDAIKVFLYLMAAVFYVYNVHPK